MLSLEKVKAFVQQAKRRGPLEKPTLRLLQKKLRSDTLIDERPASLPRRVYSLHFTQH
jgi:hypothetical protein